jgi:hypothetical protein
MTLCLKYPVTELERPLVEAGKTVVVVGPDCCARARSPIMSELSEQEAAVAEQAHRKDCVSLFGAYELAAQGAGKPISQSRLH